MRLDPTLGDSPAEELGLPPLLGDEEEEDWESISVEADSFVWCGVCGC